MSGALSVDQTLRKARTLAKKGAIAEAQALYRQVLDRFPDNKRAMEEMQALGRARGAALTPDEIGPATALYNQGRMQEALEACEALLARHPQSAVLHNLAGSCLAAMGRSEQAIASYRQALALAPHSADVRANLAAALMMLHRLDEAKELLEQALAINPDNARALNNLGSVLSEQGRSAEAIAPLDRAIALQPNLVEAYNNRGNALNHVGRTADAIADFEKAIALNPAFADAHRNLSTIKKYRPGDPQIAMIESVLPGASPSERMQLEFALGKAFDDLGETDRAFSHYASANTIRRQRLSDPLAEQWRLFESLEALFRDGVPQPPADLAPASKRPVFILGMPRSGTSLVEQILASHRDVHGGGEMGCLRQAVIPALHEGRTDEQAMRAVRDSYLGGLDALGAAGPVVTDKMPANFRWIGFIAAALPEATIIHTRRDPVAVGWSIFRTLFPAGGMEYSFDLADIAAYTKLHDELMAFWTERLSGRIHSLDYERLTENQEEETRRLLDLCGLEWDENCLAFHKTRRTVTTASSAQVRETMYTGSSQAWRPYEKYLQPLIEGLK